MTVKGTAELFIQANCLTCPHHKEVHPNNIGRAIAESATRQAKREEAAELAQGRLEEIARTNPLQVVRDDPTTDEGVRELAGLLLEPNHKIRAASSLLKAAQLRPDLFSHEVSSALQAVFGDPTVGDTVMETIRTLGSRDKAVLEEAADAGLRALVRSLNMTSAGHLLIDALEAGAIDVSTDLTTAMVMCLPIPFHFAERNGRGPRNDDMPEVVLRFARLDRASILASVKDMLSSPSDYVRAKAAAAAKVLIVLDATDALDTLLGPLLDALHLEDEDGAADATIKEALARLIRLGGTVVVDRILDEARASDEELREAFLGTFRFEDANDRAEYWLPKLLALTADSSLAASERAQIAEIVRHLSQDKPDLAFNQLESLLGLLAIVAKEREDLSQARVKQEETIWTPLAFLENEGKLSSFSLLLRHLRESIESAGFAAPEEALREVTDLGQKTAKEVGAGFRSELIDIVGTLGKVSDEPEKLVPLLFGLLLEPDSSTVRARAAEAISELIQAKNLPVPDEVVTGLIMLLDDQYLSPAIEAVRALGRIDVEDRRRAILIARRLWSMHMAYRDDTSVSLYRLISDIAETFIHLARRHVDLRPYAASLLANGAAVSYYYTAKESLQEFRWFVRSNPEYEVAFIDSLIHFYQAFDLAMNDGNYLGGRESDDSYEALYYLSSAAVRTKAASLKDLGLAQLEPWNRAAIGWVLATHEAYAEGAELFDALSAGLADPRDEYNKERFAGAANVLRAEASLKQGDRQTVIDALRAAQEIFATVKRPPRNLPFGLDEILPKEEPASEPYLVWLNLRLSWLELDHHSTKESLVQIAQQLEEFEHLTQTDEDAALAESLISLCKALDFALQWYESLLQARSETPRLMDAAKGNLERARQSLKGSSWLDLQERIADLSTILDSLSATTGVAPLLQIASSIPVPLPKLEMLHGRRIWDARPSRRGTPRPGHESIESDTSEGHASLLPVVSLRAFIDGLEAPQVTALEVDTLHELKIVADLSSAVEGSLSFKAVTVLPEASYSFPELKAKLSPEATRYEVAGPLLFKTSQAPGSSPVTVKNLVELETDAGTEAIDIVGTRTLGFRLVDKGWLGRQSAERHVALSRILDELEPKLPGRLEHEEDVLAGILNYAAYQLKDPFFTTPDVTEKDFQRDFSRYMWQRFEEDVLREVKSGRGFVDALVHGFPIELKVSRNSAALESLVAESLPQAAQYVVSQGRRLGALLVLDIGERHGSAPPLDSDVGLYEAPTDQALQGTQDVHLVVVIIRGALLSASQLR